MSLKNTITEVIVRIFVTAICVGTTIAGLITVTKLWNIRHNYKLTTAIDEVNSDIRTRTAVMGFMAIFMCLFILPGILTLITHIFKTKLRVLRIIIVLTDFLLVLLATFGYGAAGVLGCVTTTDWSSAEPYVIAGNTDYKDLKYFSHELDVIQQCTTATAVCSLIACGSCTLLLVFIISVVAKDISDRRAHGYERL